MVDSIQSSRLSSTTSSTLHSTTLKTDPLVKLSPVTLQNVKVPEGVSISEEAKLKASAEADTLKFIRKVQAQTQDSLPNERLSELKAQFQSPEGLNEYLQSVDADSIAKTLLEQKIV